MRDMDFFRAVPQGHVSWEGYDVSTPIFYYDTASLSVVWATPVDRIRALLPSDRLHPLRLTPRTGLAVTTVYDYRDSDIGPYKEVLIGFPVSVNRATPILAGPARFMAGGGSIWIWQLPVTTQIARDLGVSVAGYPKFLADIEFEYGDRTAFCRLIEGDRDVFRLQVKYGRVKPTDLRTRYQPVTVKDDHLVRCMAVANYRHLARSLGGKVTMELGDHPLAERIRTLELGRVLSVGYAPDAQSILSPPCESWPLAVEGARATRSREPVGLDA